MSYFSKYYPRINYPVGSKVKKGLWNAQLGAIYGIGSYFTLNTQVPGIIVMPTGSGKTAVLNLAPYLLRVKRVLIISSSILVRGQIFEEFSTLKTLKKSNVFHKELPSPKVKEIKSPIKSIDEWESLKNYNAVVGIPKTLNEGISNTLKPDSNLFDLVLVDEAHHVPAYTWNNIINQFSKANKIYFTATPFRRDKKEIEGKLIYNYPLSLAYEDEIFGKIGYYPVESSNTDTDLAIALEAEKILNKDKREGYDHYIMVRTDSKKHAKELASLYENQTKLNLKRIDSNLTYKTIKKTIEKLKSKKLDGIICVDMLGEGFDFPNLKIAAIHKPKKSLANTLQFIGRFARTNAKNIGEAKFIAIPNDIAIGKKKLYYKGAIWNELIQNLSEETIIEEDKNKQVLDTFKEDIVSKSISDISFYNLKPFCHVKVYKASGIRLNKIIKINGQDLVYHAVSEEYNSAFFIFQERTKPKWISSDDLIDIKNYFILIYYYEETGLFFIHSSIKTIQFYDFLIEEFAIKPYNRISKYQLNKVLLDINETEFFNIGMQNRSFSSGESYRTIAGSNAEKVIRKSYGKNYANGHVFLRGTSKSENITIGYSTGSKVWSNSYEQIPNFIKWCQTIGDKLLSNKEVKTNSGFDNLPTGIPVTKFPLRVHSLNWNGNTFQDAPILVKSNNDNEVIDEFNLLNLHLKYDSVIDNSTKLLFEVVGENTNISMMYDFINHFQYRKENDFRYFIKDPHSSYNLIEYLNENPITIYMEDFAVIADHDYYAPPKEDEFQYPADKIKSFDWKKYNTDIQVEFYNNFDEKNKNDNKNSIHETIQEYIIPKEIDILIYDHSTGEIADFIALEEFDEYVEINLYHVKSSSGLEPGDRINDLYDVCMQTIKSQLWLKNKRTFRKKMKDRVKDKNKKFVKGNFNNLSAILESSKRFDFYFTIVQPGVSKESFSTKLSFILAATDNDIIHNGYEPIKIIGS